MNEFLDYSLGVSTVIASIAFLLYVILLFMTAAEPYVQAWKEQARKNRSEWRQNIERRLQKLEEHEHQQNKEN